MIIEEFTEQHKIEAAHIAYQTYRETCIKHNMFDAIAEVEFNRGWLTAIQDAAGFAAITDSQMAGYLIGNLYGEGYHDVPLGGFHVIECTEKEKIISRLFEEYARVKCITGTNHFDIKVNAADESMLRKLSMLQFGIQSEKGVLSFQTDDKITTEATLNQVVIQKLTVDEVLQNWDAIWSMVREIVNHLKESPVYYPGTEFTETVYQEFLTDENTSVFTASLQGSFLGMIETNTDHGDLYLCKQKTANVGEIFVEKSYRKTGLAERLLDTAVQFEKSRGNTMLWVEHGTANPNAVGFWNRYFKSYCYGMIRDIIV